MKNVSTVNAKEVLFVSLKKLADVVQADIAFFENADKTEKVS